MHRNQLDCCLLPTLPQDRITMGPQPLYDVLTVWKTFPHLLWARGGSNPVSWISGRKTETELMLRFKWSPSNHLAAKLSTLRGKENHINKSLDTSWPTLGVKIWENVERWEGTKFLIATFSHLALKATKSRQHSYLHSIHRHLSIHSTKIFWTPNMSQPNAG